MKEINMPLDEVETKIRSKLIGPGRIWVDHFTETVITEIDSVLYSHVFSILSTGDVIISAPRATFKEITETVKQVWHSPGLGEIYNSDHSQMIYCKDGLTDNLVADNELANKVCNLLNNAT